MRLQKTGWPPSRASLGQAVRSWETFRTVAMGHFRQDQGLIHCMSQRDYRAKHKEQPAQSILMQKNKEGGFSWRCSGKL